MATAFVVGRDVQSMSIDTMKRPLLTVKRTVLALLLAITLAFMSVFVERTGPELVQYGNLCGAAAVDPCYQSALKGGFPVAYLVDAPGVSRERQLAFGEDKLSAGALLLDIAVYFAICMLVMIQAAPVGSVAAPVSFGDE